MLPEEQELARLTAEQTALENEVAQAELALKTERTEAQQFQRRYYDTVGRLYVELDELDAQIAAERARIAHAEAYAAYAKTDSAAAEARAAQAKAEAADASASAAREQAHASAKEAGVVDELPPAAPLTPELKTAYRQAAKLMHPDRATTEAERVRRNDYMAQVNVAYERGDLAEIERLTRAFGADPEAITGTDIGTQMVKAIRRVAQLRRRLGEIETARHDFAAADAMRELRDAVQAGEAEGADPIGDLVATLLQDISERKITLTTLQAETSTAQ